MPLHIWVCGYESEYLYNVVLLYSFIPDADFASVRDTEITVDNN